MLHLPGYQFDTLIAESRSSVVYRAKRDRDGELVLIKSLKPNASTPTEIARYRQEYQAIRQLQLEGILAVQKLELVQNLPILIFDNFPGQSLHSIVQARSLTLGEFLSISSQVAEIVGQIHTAQWVHRNLNPRNILYDPGSDTVKLTDFAIAMPSNLDLAEPPKPSVLEGTLAYVSPEQTGRMNRGVDYRTDFYSLGATFFELLTGHPPFATDDPMELVHCHIAQTPPHLRELAPAVPSAIEAIVLKLLEKMPEDRYQSAWGLQADLVLCLMQWEATGEIDLTVPAENDVVERLQIPQEVYGREVELAELAASFARIGMLDASGIRAKAAKPELVVVSGDGGVGKSTLVAESFKPISRQYGYFLSGRFEPNQEDLTYTALVQAVQEFARQLLMETDARLAEWRSRLEQDLGTNLQALGQIVPELRLALQIESVTDSARSQALTTARIFHRFFRALSCSDYPIVIFLDDLQWADDSTLQFLEDLLNDPEACALVVVVACRHTRLGTSLAQWIDRLQSRQHAVKHIDLKSLDLATTTRFIADTLHQDQRFVAPLGALVYQKTNGNPFFVREFLKTLYAEQLLRFDDESKSWQWDMEQVHAQAITDNVLDLMLNKLHKLPPATQETLSYGAFTGRTFSVAVLARLVQKSQEQIFRELIPALMEGLIQSGQAPDLSLGVEETEALLATQYEFLHDLVRQAAYQISIAEERAAIHLQIGKILREELPSDREALQQGETLLEVVYQWNAGAAAIATAVDHIEHATLNLVASRRAKVAGDYSTALNYCEMGLESLARVAEMADPDTLAPHLRFDLQLERSIVDYLQGNLERSTANTRSLLGQAQSTQDFAALYSLLVVEQTLTGEYDQIWQTLRSGLEALGVSLDLMELKSWQTELLQLSPLLPEQFNDPYGQNPQRIERFDSFDRCDSAIFTVTSANSELPDRALTEGAQMLQHQSVCSLLELAIAAAALSGDPERLGTLVIRLIEAAGQTLMPELMTAYAAAGLLLHTIGSVDRAEQWFEAARALSQVTDAPRSTYRMQTILEVYIAPWHEPLTDILPRVERLANNAIDVREVQYAGYIQAASLLLRLYSGEPLGKPLSQVQSVLEFCQRSQNHWAVTLVQQIRRTLDTLTQAEGVLDSLPVAATLTAAPTTPATPARSTTPSTSLPSTSITPASITPASITAETSPSTLPSTFDAAEAISGLDILNAAHAVQIAYLAGEFGKADQTAQSLHGHTLCLFDFIATAQYQFFWGLAIAQLLPVGCFTNLAQSTTSTALMDGDWESWDCLDTGDADSGSETRSDSPTSATAQPNNSPPTQARRTLRDRRECLQRLHALFERRYLRGVPHFQCQFLLLDGEVARLMGQDLQAINCFDRVIEIASQHHLDLYRAIAQELTGQLWLRRDKLPIARFFLLEACQAYQHWGCVNKVLQIQASYPQCFVDSLSGILPTTPTPIALNSPNLFPELSNLSQLATPHPDLDVETPINLNLSVTTLGEPSAANPYANPYSPATPFPIANIPASHEPELTLDLSDEPHDPALDVNTVMKAAQILSGEVVLDRLLDKLMNLLLANAGATAGCLSLVREGGLQIAIFDRMDSHPGDLTGGIACDLIRELPQLSPLTSPTPGDQSPANLPTDAPTDAPVSTSTSTPTDTPTGTPTGAPESLPVPVNAPWSLLNYVARLQDSITIHDTSTDNRFANDPYIQRAKPKSILCMPIQGQGKLIGVLYLENSLTVQAFTSERRGVLMLLCAQAAIALENAQLYDTLCQSEQRERERAAQLDQSLTELKDAQLQIIQSEKMAALGQLVAGIAHEINNPIGFIDANLSHAQGYVEDILSLLELFQEIYGDEENEEIVDRCEDIDLAFIQEDLPKLLQSMRVGTDRIRQISRSLRTFSRSDTVEKVAVDLHEGIDSTLMILKPRLKFTEFRPTIEVIKNYGNLPLIHCFAGQLNQVFTNIIANAIDAINELVEADRQQAEPSSEQTLQPTTQISTPPVSPHCITITTSIETIQEQEQEQVIISIRDNGPGIPEAVQKRIFEHLFTTKSVGKGTGLGLSISYQIVVEKHGGTLTCRSQPGEGTEFIISIPIE